MELRDHVSSVRHHYRVSGPYLSNVCAEAILQFTQSYRLHPSNVASRSHIVKTPHRRHAALAYERNAVRYRHSIAAICTGPESPFRVTVRACEAVNREGAAVRLSWLTRISPPSASAAMRAAACTPFPT